MGGSQPEKAVKHKRLADKSVSTERQSHLQSMQSKGLLEAAILQKTQVYVTTTKTVCTA